MALFEPDRHEPLTTAAWDEAAASDHLDLIVADSHAAYRGEEGLWPIHPMDVSDERPNPMKNLYYGAAGVIWALNYLEHLGAVERGRDYRPVLAGLLPRVREDSLRLTGKANHGFLPGETGVLAFQRWFDLPVDDDALAAGMLAHRDDPSDGFLAGAPGVILAALDLHQSLWEPQWADVCRKVAEAVWGRWRYNEAAGCWLWRQDLYGEQACQLGALHGFAGVAHALLSVQHLMPENQRAELTRRVKETVTRTAMREGDLVNWPFEADGSAHPGSGALRVQHCMGAPGFITCLADFQVGDPEIDGLLLGAGELIWRAGPLAKHPCLCHGTPGNGMALLKLWQRTGDAVWLERARAFAMHAIEQNRAFTTLHGQRKFSLWTGDLGLACFLWGVIRETAWFPMLDGL